jgi:hypothetical protein
MSSQAFRASTRTAVTWTGAGFRLLFFFLPVAGGGERKESGHAYFPVHQVRHD